MALNIFKFFSREKPEEKTDIAGIKPEELEKQKKEKITINQGITIHTMPDHYRFKHVKVNNAKTAGFLIIFLGIIFLIAVAAALYYFLFKSSPPTEETNVNPPVTENSQVKEDQPEEKPATNSVPEIQTPATTTPILNSVNQVTPLATTTEATSSLETVNQPESFTAGTDSDGDGLNDAEEMILGTNPNLSDSDNDGYSDLAELNNLFNPAGNGKITSNPNIITYKSGSFNYSLLYPKQLSQSTNGGDDSVMFKTADNQFVQIIIEPNPNGLMVVDWYKLQFNVNEINPDNYLSGKDWSGIRSSDDLIVYLTDTKRKYIYTLTYNPGSSNVLNYINIFKFIVKSFWTNN